MKLTYDPSVDAAYIMFEENACEEVTQRLSEDIAVNYARDGRIVGFEILSAREHLFQSTQEPAVELENLKVAKSA